MTTGDSVQVAALVFDAVITAVNAGCVLSVFLWRRGFAKRQEIAELDRRVNDLEHGPGWNVFNTVKTELSEVKSALAAISAKLEMHARSVDRIERYLMEHR